MVGQIRGEQYSAETRDEHAIAGSLTEAPLHQPALDVVHGLDLDPARVLTESDPVSAPMPTLNPISPALDPAYGAAITEMMVRNHRLVRAARKLRALGRVFRSVTPD